MSTRPFYVRIVRDDATLTYKGPLSTARATREADAWVDAFPAYAVAIVPVSEFRDECKRWQQVVNRTGKCYVTDVSIRSPHPSMVVSS